MWNKLITTERKKNDHSTIWHNNIVNKMPLEKIYIKINIFNIQSFVHGQHSNTINTRQSWRNASSVILA